jgi:hypothetical protein
VRVVAVTEHGDVHQVRWRRVFPDLGIDAGKDAAAQARDLHGRLDATSASVFVARSYAGFKVESLEGVFRVHEDAPEQRIITPMPDAVNGSGDRRRFRPVAAYGAASKAAL